MRALPHDLEAEKSVLGAVFVREDAMADIGALAPSEFYSQRHQALWQAILDCRRGDRPIDETTVGNALQERGALAAVGLTYIAEVAIAVPTADNAAHYAKIVRSLAVTRGIMVGLSGVLQSGYAGAGGLDMVAGITGLLHTLDEHTGFVGADVRIMGERADRAKLLERELRFNVTFLDDYLGGLRPHDLVVIGARTGVGKTQLAQLIAQTNAMKGRRVYLFALEAEPREIERRIKFEMLAGLVFSKNLAGKDELNYRDWYRGVCEHITGRYEALAEEVMSQQLTTLHTLYRGRDFTVDDIEHHIRAIQGRADLIVLDHLHYVDSDDPNENRAVKTIIKRIRDVSLAIGVPAVVVAHLRKSNPYRRTLMPEIDDFHGTSDITKIATTVVLLSRARDKASEYPWISNTYIQIPKSRIVGACPYVAVCGYDLRRNTYEKAYMLGRPNLAGDEVELIDNDKYPRWANRWKNA